VVRVVPPRALVKVELPFTTLRLNAMVGNLTIVG